MLTLWLPYICGCLLTILAWVIATKRATEKANILSEIALNDYRTRLAEESRCKIQAETERTLLTHQLSEEKKRLQELGHTFQSLASTSLKNNNDSFLTLAKESVVNPIAEKLHLLNTHIQHLEKNRQESTASLDTQIKGLLGSQDKLQKETANLVSALRTPQVRGRWGEITLKRVVELAGMSNYCDFNEQVSKDSDDGKIRPDVIIRMPSKREIVVDAKVALDAYLDALSANSEETRAIALNRHATQIRTHMRALSEKKYWEQFDQAPDFVIMFIPGESFFGAAVDADPTLVEDGLKKGVLLSTPTTLMGLLRVIEYGWKQASVTESAQKISQLGKQLHERIGKFSEHLHRMGKGLETANKAFNDSVGSFEHNVLTSARRFKELGAGSSKDLDSIILNPLDIQPRLPTA